VERSPLINIEFGFGARGGWLTQDTSKKSFCTAEFTDRSCRSKTLEVKIVYSFVGGLVSSRLMYFWEVQFSWVARVNTIKITERAFWRAISAKL
jgi:hypothetical protein